MIFVVNQIAYYLFVALLFFNNFVVILRVFCKYLWNFFCEEQLKQKLFKNNFIVILRGFYKY
jgi:hypothetical protein